MTRKAPIEFRSIIPRGGDQRTAFEELSCLLFAREHAVAGTLIRREGTGGDSGLEAIIADEQGRALLGIQAKFYTKQLGATQWRDLDQSVRTALADNAADRTLREIVVSLPRNLTQAQEKRWFQLIVDWRNQATTLGYETPITFTLWHETFLRGLLLHPENRPLFLYFFGYPHLDVQQCRRRTEVAIKTLGDRYLPDLHTTTTAEGMLHTFLRSERSRQDFLKVARDKLNERWWWTNTWREDWPQNLHLAKDVAEEAWNKLQGSLVNGVSLPISYRDTAGLCKAVASSLDPVEKILAALVPRRVPDERSSTSRHPMEEALERTDRWASALWGLAGYLQQQEIADSACLLLSGDPGSGKTHVLAEVCSRYGRQGGIAIFLEGAVFASNDPPWQQLLRQLDHYDENFRDFLLVLSATAESTGLPALLCIDGINETPNRDLWRTGIEALAAEVRSTPGVKLIVSCRSDYLEQTLPESLAFQKAKDWAFAEHEGLGFELHEAFPKYIAAYHVQWNGLPPLTREFGNPLFLRTFCEAFSGQTPEAGIFSLGKILQQYAKRKALLLGKRIDCDSAKILHALRDLADAMQENHALQLPERKAQEICQHHHGANRASRSLYRALLSEGVLMELPGVADALGETQLVRFTYERVWDYFVGLRLLPEGSVPTEDLVTQLRDSSWLSNNAGVVNLLFLRFAEAGYGELFDKIADEKSASHNLWEIFLETIPWRTSKSISPRTKELLNVAFSQGLVQDEFDFFIPLAANPHHPWNANWLHDRLMKMKISERDRHWTFWVNRELLYSESSYLWELISWAERANVSLLADEYLELLATILAWCASTTVPQTRLRLAAILSRLLAGRTAVAVRLVRRFLAVDDTYVLERVLLAAAGSAQHADEGDPGLAELADVVYDGFFAGETVAPHIAVRHYAREVCEQALKKNVLPKQIPVSEFRPPFASRWPRIWSKEHYEREKALHQDQLKIFSSVEPGPQPPYGNWGRYVMSTAVHQFQSRRLTGSASTDRSDWFDAQTAARYVVQRVFALGWNPKEIDSYPRVDWTGVGQRPLERLSKKYQWIALAELLGYLADHFHFHDFNGKAQPLQSAKQLLGTELPDPYVREFSSEKPSKDHWDFVASPEPWWKGGLSLFSRPLSLRAQCALAEKLENFDPRKLLTLNDGSSEWLTLSAFHRWAEPLPVWHGNHMQSHVASEWAMQSYLVPEKNAKDLLVQLSERIVGHSRFWLEEPEFGRSLAAIRDYPSGQERLRARCELDQLEDTDKWNSDAFSTTCRYGGDGDNRRAREGSMPSPQLAELGNLKWMGRGFDFASPNNADPIVQHVGEGFEGACIIQRQSILDWLRDSNLRLVWRVYGFKFRLHEYDENHARSYWASYSLEKDGTIKLRRGATCSFPGGNGPGPDQALPAKWWKPLLKS